MPFFWKPDSKRTQISPERMKSAVLQVVVEGRSIRSASKDHRIDRKTLGRYVQKYRNTKDEEIELKPNYSSAQIFTDPEETLLEEYFNLAAEIHYGLTSKVARQIAYEHGIALKKVLPDNWYAARCASYDWLRGFLHRHKSFKLKNTNSGGVPEFGVNDFLDLKPRNKYIAEVFESVRIQESKLINESESKLVANESGVPSVKNTLTEQNIELKTVHDPDCLLNTMGCSSFTPFCTCQYKSENHVSIIPIKSVPKPEDMYILPTTDEPKVSGSTLEKRPTKCGKEMPKCSAESSITIIPINTACGPHFDQVLKTNSNLEDSGTVSQRNNELRLDNSRQSSMTITAINLNTDRLQSLNEPRRRGRKRKLKPCV